MSSSVLVLPLFLSIMTRTFIPPSKLGTVYIARRNTYIEAKPLPLQAWTLPPRLHLEYVRTPQVHQDRMILKVYLDLRVYTSYAIVD